MIAAVGDNLFQTLMLNLTFLKDGRSLWEGEERPVWEREPSKKERQEIAVPDNLAELLTLLASGLRFKTRSYKVVGYICWEESFFDKKPGHMQNR